MVTAGVLVRVSTNYIFHSKVKLFSNINGMASHCVTHSGGRHKHRQDFPNIILLMSEIKLYEASYFCRVFECNLRFRLMLKFPFVTRNYFFSRKIFNSMSDDERFHFIF